MKLIFDATELSYYNENNGHRAGVFNAARSLFDELYKLGVDITFTCDYRRYYFLKEVDKFKNIPLLKENSFINRLWGKIIYCTRNLPIRIRYAILILSRFYDAYFYKINKRNLEQLEEFDAYFSPYTPPSKEIEQADLKHIRMLHDLIPIIENGYPKSPKDWYYKIYTTLNNKNFYIVDSQSTKNDLLKYYPDIDEENVRVTLLGADERFAPKKVDNSEKYVLSLCTLGKRKNLEFTIRNFFNFIETNNIKDLKLYLAGGIWKKFENNLENILHNYDREKVKILGYVDDDKLAELYSNALFFVFPSIYEGFGLPVLEAMQCECPVITSNTSSLPEVIGEAGIKIDPKCDEEMIDAMTKMYKDEFFRQLCSERGLIRSRNFSWNKCAKELLEFIREKNTPIK